MSVDLRQHVRFGLYELDVHSGELDIRSAPEYASFGSSQAADWSVFAPAEVWFMRQRVL